MANEIVNGTQVMGTPVNAGTEGGTPAQDNVQNQPIPVVATPVPVTTQPQQDGWWKRNWKKVTGAAAAVVTVVGSALVAYNKGKADATPPVQNQPQGYDPAEYALNPNVE